MTASTLPFRENSVIVDRKHKIIRQELRMDESSSVLEYLSIYLPAS